jgi:hypothetical protein
MSDEKDLNRIMGRFLYGNPYKQGAVLYKTDRNLQNFSTHSSNAKVIVRFEKIDELIIELLHTYDAAVGAVAWLTNPDILDAMAKLQHVAIVVQKEDFLRRDIDVAVYSLWKKKLHDSYNRLKPIKEWDFAYPDCDELDPDFNWAVQSWLHKRGKGSACRADAAIRCLGFARSNRETPRMHHKFLVLGHKADGGMVIRPRCVVSGSFNMSQNATRSRENVLVVEDQNICNAYVSEWAQLWCLSEDLDWASPEPVSDRNCVGGS